MFKNNLDAKTGHFLLSEPFMQDPNFNRSVILLCEDVEDGGCVGFILNKPINRKLSDAINELEGIDNDLFYGGPIAQESLHYLHSFGHLIENSLCIAPHVFWGGNFQQLITLLKTGKIDPKKVKFFLGYSGWEAGQLADELTENSWLVVPSNPKFIFNNNGKELWKMVLNELGGKYQQLAQYPENPAFN